MECFLEDIEPIDDRIMTITLSGTLPVTIICNYTPTAKATKEEKEKQMRKVHRQLDIEEEVEYGESDD